MFTVDDKIKLNPEIFPIDKLENKTFQAGVLSYPVLILDWEMCVVDAFVDPYHGQMVSINVLNDERVAADVLVYFRVDDCVISKAIKLKIEYTILGKMLKVQPLINANRDQRAVLMKERAKLKRQVSTPLKEKEIKANWKQVSTLDKALIEIQKDESTVFIVAHKLLGQVELDCKEEHIENKLRQLLSQKRKALRKIIPIDKIVEGDLVYKKVGLVASEAGQIAKISKDFAVKVINAPKKPKTDKDNYVGIELECFSTKTIEEMKTVFIKAGLKGFVNITTDSSIRPEVKRNQAMEIRVCVMEKDLDTVFPRIMKVVDDNDCKVNTSCGTHVHLDMRNRNPELAYSNLYKSQDLMLALQPEERRKNTYCAPNTTPEIALKDFGQNQRRAAINATAYPKHKTIEIRLHHGTVNYPTLNHWIKFLVAIASLNVKMSKKISTTAELESLGLVSAETITNFKARVKKYA